MFPTPTTCPTQLKCVQARSREEGAGHGLRGTLHAGLAPRGHLPPLRAMVCDDGSHASSPHVRRKSLRRLASTRGFKPRASNDYGWIRVFEGLEPFSVDAPSKLVKVALNTTVEDVNKKLGFTDELTLWIQTGGENSRRLELDEFPLRIQEQFLATCGWKSEARRLRLAVDPELRHSLRWCVGPAAREDSVLRSGTLYILKGHVFPQWKPRPAYVIGSRLHTYGAAWELVELSGGSIELCPPKAQRLVLCVKPHCQGSGGDTGTNHIFLGFSTIWERNLWFCWLKEATQSTQPPNVLDLSGGGRASLGASLAQHSAGAFTIRVLRLKGSSLATLPFQTWTLQALTHLDISENRISNLPAEMCQLTQLEELHVSDNELRSLEVVLRLPRLRILLAARNLITSFGASNIAQMTHNILDEEHKTEHRAPLTTVDLRHNRLKGSIILGNYEHLVSLDVSHNLVEVLVVSSLRGLRELYAAHNSLQHLALHGASLRTLRAPHNQLETLTTTVPPINLVEVNLSHNKLTSLPQWLSGCSDLTTLHASNNQLTSLPDHLFCSELSSLSNVHLAHNKISSIPSMPRLRAPLKELLLHDNCIQQLPENFFSVCDRLCILNLSNNRLSRLPNTRGPSHCLERLYLTANCLTDDVADVIVAFRNLKILHIAYNCLTNLPESCINFWPDIEEFVLSGNALSRLPETLPQLNNIRILRAHSNRLRSVPMFACSASVKILDFAHNELDSIDLRLLAPKQLKFLDISCNKKLQVDPTQFNSYRCQRPLSLVDVTGRHTLPWTQRSGYHEELNGSSPWSTGFSECPNSSLQLCCAQIRLPSFCNKEGLFAIIDGENDIEVPKILQTCLPGLLLEEKSIKETVNEYMKYVVLSAHRELKEKGQRNGACLIMCHLSPINTSENGFGNAPKRYSLKLANVGDTKAVLSRRNGPLSLGIENNKRLGYSSRYPNTVPDPDVIQTIIKEDDEFLILGNGHFWNAISMDTAVSEVRAERNPVLAAKRLQDLAQSYGVEECISVLIIRFDAMKSDVDLLMKELRQTISTTKSVCRSDCCCSRLEPCCHSSTPPKSCSDRSSPSGQSDRPLSEAINHQHYASVRSQAKASERRSCRGGVARAIRVRVEEDKEEDSRNEELPNSEEQFKCWEYMLEQNTQMLFDKELDNLSKGIKSNVSSLRNIKGLSGSSPQLHLAGKQSKGVPFLSKHFGSARSFGNNLKPDLRFGSGRVPIGGPNAAYFGSLQRLMPYHLEYDFAVIQEKSAHSQDSLDLEGRMQQYWGVATTEL